MPRVTPEDFAKLRELQRMAAQLDAQDAALRAELGLDAPPSGPPAGEARCSAPASSLICKRCGTPFTVGNAFHQTECLSEWVEAPANHWSRKAEPRDAVAAPDAPRVTDAPSADERAQWARESYTLIAENRSTMEVVLAARVLRLLEAKPAEQAQPPAPDAPAALTEEERDQMRLLAQALAPLYAEGSEVRWVLERIPALLAAEAERDALRDALRRLATRPLDALRRELWQHDDEPEVRSDAQIFRDLARLYAESAAGRAGGAAP